MPLKTAGGNYQIRVQITNMFFIGVIPLHGNIGNCTQGYDLNLFEEGQR